MSIVTLTMSKYKLHRTQLLKLFKSPVASDHVLTAIYVNMRGGLEQHRTQVFKRFFVKKGTIYFDNKS